MQAGIPSDWAADVATMGVRRNGNTCAGEAGQGQEPEEERHSGERRETENLVACAAAVPVPAVHREAGQLLVLKGSQVETQQQ